ncbi:hypothetical protein FF38_02615 [Lucilia cuprina]|uniref:Uncharacterized protein n=1 Tax=Lucilia cuprina TaxID=7375 RepID=A0A0L0CK50_LUCCU|nr:hypothetical protein FF38_02615 [Lucilia cuprina]
MSFDDLASYNDRRKAILKLLDPKKPNLPSTIMEENEELEEESELEVNGTKEGVEDAPDTSKFNTSINTSVNIPRDQSMMSAKVDFGEDANWLGDSKSLSLAKLHHMNLEYRVQVYDIKDLVINLKVSHTKSRFKRALKLTSTPDGSYSKLELPSQFYKEQKMTLEGFDVWNTKKLNSRVSLNTLYLPCVFSGVPATLAEAKSELSKAQQDIKFSSKNQRFQVVQIGGDVTHKTRQFECDANAPLLIAYNMSNKPRALINLGKLKSHKLSGLLELEFQNGSELKFKQTDEVLKEFTAKLLVIWCMNSVTGKWAYLPRISTNLSRIETLFSISIKSVLEIMLKKLSN